jgi:hypothetical protein
LAGEASGIEGIEIDGMTTEKDTQQFLFLQQPLERRKLEVDRLGVFFPVGDLEFIACIRKVVKEQALPFGFRGMMAFAELDHFFPRIVTIGLPNAGKQQP